MRLLPIVKGSFAGAEMMTYSSVQVVCVEYEGLLNESEVALARWANKRAEIPDRRERDIPNELQTLQGDFLRLWGMLQNHRRDCKVCHVLSSAS
jgi:succinate dehydrogenase flavin-adding protein (antitoxin of CptAB toxin-antitoxin module)